MQRYFTDQKLKTGDVVQLDATIAKHAIKVLRQDIGDRFELVDPMHHAYLAIIQQSSPLQVAIDEDITKKLNCHWLWKLSVVSAKGTNQNGSFKSY